MFNLTLRSYYTLNTAQQYQQQTRQALRELSLNANGSPRRRVPAEQPNSENASTAVSLHTNTQATDAVLRELFRDSIQTAQEGLPLEEVSVGDFDIIYRFIK